LSGTTHEVGQLSIPTSKGRKIDVDLEQVSASATTSHFTSERIYV
jgi:hypothetical protein